jgi:hypothetical protein
MDPPWDGVRALRRADLPVAGGRPSYNDLSERTSVVSLDDRVRLDRRPLPP